MAPLIILKYKSEYVTPPIITLSWGRIGIPNHHLLSAWSSPWLSLWTHHPPLSSFITMLRPRWPLYCPQYTLTLFLLQVLPLPGTLFPNRLNGWLLLAIGDVNLSEGSSRPLESHLCSQSPFAFHLCFLKNTYQYMYGWLPLQVQQKLSESRNHACHVHHRIPALATKPSAS